MRMADLREELQLLGFTWVATVVQSGNIVFESTQSDRAAKATLVDLLLSRFDVRAPITLRTKEGLATALDSHPFERGVVDPKFHHIMFLTDPAPADADLRLADRVDGDDFAVIGNEVHVLYRNGSARARFNVDWVGRTLDTVATARNLPTCEKVLSAFEM